MPGIETGPLGWQKLTCYLTKQILTVITPSLEIMKLFHSWLANAKNRRADYLECTLLTTKRSEAAIFLDEKQRSITDLITF